MAEVTIVTDAYLQKVKAENENFGLSSGIRVVIANQGSRRMRAVVGDARSADAAAVRPHVVASRLSRDV